MASHCAASSLPPRLTHCLIHSTELVLDASIPFHFIAVPFPTRSPLPCLQVPEGMDADLFYEKFCRHVDIVNGAFEKALEEAKQAPRDSRMQYLQML